MEESLPDADPLDSSDGIEEETDQEVTTADSESLNVVIDGNKDSGAPAVGMEFDSYNDVYNFCNIYAKKLGFDIKVRNVCLAEEKYRAVLCCSNQGFKKKKTCSGAEMSTTCPAMVTINLVGKFKWRVTEVVLEHNHSIRPRKTAVVGISGKKWLELKEGDAQAIYDFFCRMQVISPNFFYLMDLDSKGCLGNVFWADARSRAAYSYFGDVVTFDSTYVENKYEVTCVPFVGLNHHGQSVLLGCGVLADETFESYVWLLKSWLTCMLGHPPSVIITDHCKIIQRAVMDVFPSARHCFSFLHIMNKATQELQRVHPNEAIRKILNKAVYDSLTVDEFETTWKDMVEQYGVKDQEWLQTLYHDRKQWVPVFLKDFLFAGMSTSEEDLSMQGYFDGFLSKETSLKEFFGKYESALEKERTSEAREEFGSIHSQPNLKTRCCFEFQISKLYTKEIFRKLQYEVEELFSCFNTAQLHADGPNATYIVKECREGEGNQREIRNFEVLYNIEKQEISCICGLFNFRGYLCRHALSVLNYNGVEEIPSQYIIPRWRKDFKRASLLNNSTTSGDDDSRAQWYDHLFRCAVQVVEEGAVSQEHYKVALQALEETQNKVCLAEETQQRMTPTTLQPCTTSTSNQHQPLLTTSTTSQPCATSTSTSNQHEPMSTTSTTLPPCTASTSNPHETMSTRSTTLQPCTTSTSNQHEPMSTTSTKDAFLSLPKAPQNSRIKSSRLPNTIDKSILVDVSNYFTTDQVFNSPEEVKEWAKTVGKQHGTMICIQRSDKESATRHPRLYLACERGRKPNTTSKGIRKVTSKRCECPFGLKCKFNADGQGQWKVKVIVDCGFHNHALDTSPEGIRYRLNKEELKIVKNMTKIGFEAKAIMHALKERNPHASITLKQVYNARFRFRLIREDGTDGQSQTQEQQKTDESCSP